MTKKYHIHSSDGYVLLYCPEHKRSDERGYVKEHIVIMEKYIGREFSVNECIHHINGNKTDNSIKNLKLMTNSEHRRHHALLMGLGKDNIGKIPWNKGLSKKDHTNVCGGRHKGIRIKKICIVCGKEFQVTPYFKDKVYCSHKCLYSRFSKNGSDNITINQVIEIKKALSKGIKGVILAKKYNVSEAIISAIKTNKSYKEI